LTGVARGDVLHAAVAFSVAVVVCGIPAARQLQKHSPIYIVGTHHVTVDYARAAVVAIILSTAVVVNALSNLKFGHLTDHIPFIGIAV